MQRTPRSWQASSSPGTKSAKETSTLNRLSPNSAFRSSSCATKAASFSVAVSSSPDWSPLGETLVYAKQVSSSAFVIVRHDLDTNVVTRLTTSDVSSESPSFSGDGRYVVFQRRRGDKAPKLWIMQADGSHPRPISTPEYPMFAPDWHRPSRSQQ